MLLYILLGVVVALGIVTWFMSSDGEFVGMVLLISTLASAFVLMMCGATTRDSHIESTYRSSVTTMSNHSGDKGFAFVDGDNLVFKTKDGVRTVPYADARIREVDGAGDGEVAIADYRNTYGWVLPWSNKGKTTIELYIPRGGLGVM